MRESESIITMNSLFGEKRGLFVNLIQRIDRFIDRVTEWIYERYRDHTRDELCIALQGLGINAQMSERGRPEEEITSRWFESLMLGVKYLGIIEVQNPVIS